MSDPNFLTGSNGLIAVDKAGNQVLFLDPDSYETTLTLDGFAPRVHELLIAPDRNLAYVPIYGDGIHGKNPHPGHLIAVFDLNKRRHAGDFSTYPYVAQHGLRWGPEGQLYCLCENSGVILEMDAQKGSIEHVIEVGSNKAHRMEVMPGGEKLYTENEEDTFGCVIDLKARKRIKKVPAPNGLAGIGMSPDGKTIILVDAQKPQIMVVETERDPDGKYLIVTSFDAPLATIFSADLGEQNLLHLGQGPMNMAFHEEGRLVLIANQSEGTLAVCDIERAEVLRTVPAGVGVEALSFY